MENREIELGLKSKESLFKLILNDQGEFIYINDKDTSIFDKYADFVRWIDTKSMEVEERGKELKKEYGDTIVSYDKDGDVEEVNVDAYLAFSKLRTDSFKEVAEQVESIFGGEILHKYFRPFYDLNPNFVPDDECIYDFMGEITPVLNNLFADRKTRIETKYSRNRQGSKKTKYRRK